jgi:hypothetical protein
MPSSMAPSFEPLKIEGHRYLYDCVRLHSLNVQPLKPQRRRSQGLNRSALSSDRNLKFKQKVGVGPLELRTVTSRVGKSRLNLGAGTLKSQKSRQISKYIPAEES